MTFFVPWDEVHTTVHRRTLLERGWAATVAVGLAGCLESEGETDADPSSGDVTEPEPEGETTDSSTRSDAGLERWLIDPGTDVDEYTVRTLSRAALEPVDEGYDGAVLDEFEADFRDPTLGAVVGDEYDRALEISAAGDSWYGFDAVSGEFDAAAVGAAFEDREFEPGERHEGYRFYSHELLGVYAVRSDAVLALPSRRFDERRPESVLEAIEGADSYADPAFDRLLDALPDGQVRTARVFEPIDEFDPERVEFEGMHASGISYDVGESETRVTRVVFVTDGDLVSETDVRTVIDRHVEDPAEATAAIDGDRITYEVTFPTAEFG